MSQKELGQDAPSLSLGIIVGPLSVTTRAKNFRSKVGPRVVAFPPNTTE